jgi:hypothetical protein
LLLVGAFLLVSGVFPGLAWSQVAIDIRANQAQTQFPDEIVFALEIDTSSPIESIELEYGVEKISCGQSSGRVVPDIHETLQRRRVHATWTWELYRSGSMPPGAQVWWRWHITTEDGQSQSTRREWITLDDQNHAWQTLSEGQITVHWYEGDQEFAQYMLQSAVQAQARLTSDPGANLEKPLHFYLYADSDALKAALISPQRWTGGIAFTDFYTVLIATGPQEQDYGQRIVAHELMHLVVHQLAFNCWSSLPRWLDEGLASWAEGDLEPSQQEALNEAIAENALLPLPSLNGSFSAHADRAYLSYAQSYSVVAFLMNEYGRDKILELLAVFREGATYDGALEQVYGFDTEGLENLWRASIDVPPRPTAIAPDDGEPTPVPTLSLWSQEPTALLATMTATPAPSPQPSATSAPTPTKVLVAVAPTARATRAANSGPQLITGPPQQTHTDSPTGYIIVAAGSLALLALVLAAVYVYRR